MKSTTYTENQAPWQGFSPNGPQSAETEKTPPPAASQDYSEPARIWRVGDLCLAVAQALDTAFNPVQVRGEISGFSRAASGHCYFSMKDAQGQIRCAMFRRAAVQLDFSPQDGEQVEALGRLGVYEQRGDLQLVVQSMRRAGQGALYEQFLQRKARLEALGLFAQERKRPLPLLPRGIGVVTSLGAAALHDVVCALQRRVPHIPVLIAPAAVQGLQAPAELIASLSNLYHYAQASSSLDGDLSSKNAGFPLDVILLVRGGGSLEDLWAFNDEALVHAIAQSPVPVISGVGHETDFTLADFACDLRAPTPTAAAELVAAERSTWIAVLAGFAQRLQAASQRQLDRHSQRLDAAGARLGRPSGALARQQLRLSQLGQRMHFGSRLACQQRAQALAEWQLRLSASAQVGMQRQEQRLARAQLRLELLDPRLVLQRGYAWLTDAQGGAITQVAQTHLGQQVRATLVDGQLHLQVSQSPRNKQV